MSESCKRWAFCFRENILCGIAHQCHVAGIPRDDLRSCYFCRPRSFPLLLWYLCSLLSQTRTSSSQQFSNYNQHHSIFNSQHIDWSGITCQPYHENICKGSSAKRIACQPALGWLHLDKQESKKTSATPPPAENRHLHHWPRKLCSASCVSCVSTVARRRGGSEPYSNQEWSSLENGNLQPHGHLVNIPCHINSISTFIFEIHIFIRKTSIDPW